MRKVFFLGKAAETTVTNGSTPLISVSAGHCSLLREVQVRTCLKYVREHLKDLEKCCYQMRQRSSSWINSTTKKRKRKTESDPNSIIPVIKHRGRSIMVSDCFLLWVQNDLGAVRRQQERMRTLKSWTRTFLP